VLRHSCSPCGLVTHRFGGWAYQPPPIFYEIINWINYFKFTILFIDRGWSMSEVNQKYHWDNIDEKMVVESTQDTASILELNKEERNDFDTQKNSDMKYKEGWTKVATIPNIIIDQLMKDGVWFDKKKMKQWLNDPDNKYFRTGGKWI
tara:strand:+ start:882 stop:1325 length:444 start_codon:yes stop_codon:yes gene_type:complete